MKKDAPNQLDMWDLNGVDKLSLDSVKNREAVIKHYAKNKRGIFYVSTSGGVDSTCLAILVRKLVPKEQIVYLHATLGKYEYDVIDYIKETTDGGKLEVVGHASRSLLDSALLRGRFFSSQIRFCTSEHKTNPLFSFIRSDFTARQKRGENVSVAFNCTGILACESRQRATKNPLFINKALTTKSRTVYDWMPCFHLSKAEVWEVIKEAGLRPHPTYGKEMGEGNERLSCRVCIMQSVSDGRRGAISSPDVYHELIAAERVLGHTMHFKTKQRTEYKKVFDLIKNKEVVVDKIVHKTVIKIPLNERLGVPFDELAVQRKMQELRARREELLNIKSMGLLEKENKKRAKQAAAIAKTRDDKTGTFDF